MSRPTSQEFHRAVDLGGQARRAGHKEDRNPYRHGLTDKDRILADAWQAGFDNGKGGKR
jgi:hypothetical protein